MKRNSPSSIVRLLKLAVGAFCLCQWGFSVAATTPEVKVVRVPGGGLQPQAVVDARGVIHVAYLGGEARAADVFYAKLPTGADKFTLPLRVNSQSGTATAVGTVRGAQLALGGDGRVHVAWNGCGKADSAPGSVRLRSPMLYARLNDSGTAFEAQRDLMTRTSSLDGGGSVAADANGNVIVAWHAAEAGKESGETGRAVWLARSMDGGRSFSREERAGDFDTGACACCGMKALADSRGGFHLLYRTAKSGLDRTMTRLFAESSAGPFRAQPLELWRVGMCPMSSESLIESGGEIFAAWETALQVRFAEVGTGKGALKIVTPPGVGKRKHPSLARNPAGVTLLAWSENTSFNSGGAVVWQLFDASGQPLGVAERRADLVKWNLPATAACADGSFLVIY